jgi:DNA-binding transcriptional LysR family regulator
MDYEAYSELSLRELRILHVLLQQRSITRTAQAMETTQPSISKVLRRLREQFSDPLFIRNGQAMQPTAKALDIADRLGILLAAADGLRASAREFDPAHSDRRFSLLLTDVGMVHFLPPLIARVSVSHPMPASGPCRSIRVSSNTGWKAARRIWRSAPFRMRHAI